MTSTVSRLRASFNDIESAPPLDREDLDQVLDGLPSRPKEAETLWGVCDGLRVGTPSGDLTKMNGAREAVEGHMLIASVDGPERLLPIRGDGNGNHDCLVIGEGPGAGAVVFWDHEKPEAPSYLLASSIAAYLDMWSDNVCARYDRHGAPRPEFDIPELDAPPWIGEPEKEHGWPFNLVWMCERDSGLIDLLVDEEVTGWLATSPVD